MPPGMFNRATERAGYTSLDDSDDDDASAAGVTRRIDVEVGRMNEVVRQPIATATAIATDILQDNPYENLDAPDEEELAARGRAIRNGAANTAGQLIGSQALQTTSAAVIGAAGGAAPGVQVIGSVPAAINAGHTAQQATNLHQIANEMASMTGPFADLRQTISNAASLKGWKTGGQLTSIAIGLGAAGCGVAAGTLIGGAVVVTGGLALVPVAVIGAGVGMGAAAGGAGASFAARKAIARFSWRRLAVRPRAVAVALVNAALDPDAQMRSYARRALEALGFQLDRLPTQMPPEPEDRNDPDAQLLRAAYDDVERRF